MFYDQERNMWFETRKDYERNLVRNRVRDEGWVEIGGFTRYLISPSGEIANADRMSLMSTVVRNGHLTTSLVNDANIRQTVSVARLVAYAYLGAPDEELGYFDIVFVDGDQLNVHVDNLRWRPRWDIRQQARATRSNHALF